MPAPQGRNGGSPKGGIVSVSIPDAASDPGAQFRLTLQQFGNNLKFHGFPQIVFSPLPLLYHGRGNGRNRGM
ncbi:hypothetical protein HMSSN139_48050 [Paenibacillus sp. HMSSN-139]|nr:hypothetical protein HMSSN139_48050 [Paenibacillus sp. HMSSN-139]